MKVVCCKNCGAKYQLDDNDDITTFECSSCAGDLEYIENYSGNEINQNSDYLNSYQYDNSYIVQCADCGLKYKINTDDNIIDYECDSCGGPLRYLDEEMNKELDKYLEERREEIEKMSTVSNFDETPQEETTENNNRSLKSLTGRLENFFSEEHMLEIADEEKREKELENGENVKTARTTIPNAVLNKFGREFAIPKTNDYYILKNFLKDEFYKGLEEYYPKPVEKEESKSFLDKISIKEPDLGEPDFDSFINFESDIDELTQDDEEETSRFSIQDLTINHVFIIGSAIIFVISIVEILTTNSGIGIVALFVGVIGLIYGIYNSRSDSEDSESVERKRIIREHLLTLPEDYYLFYNVKIPISSSSINHLVVGPTGIFALLSQKYNPNTSLNADGEPINFNTSLEDEKIKEVSLIDGRKFKYTTKQAKFSQDNEIKQKALSLGEDLINFLNDNDIKNCFVEPLVGFVNNDVVVINMPLTDEDLFIDELLVQIQNTVRKLDQETIEKCAVLINRYSADCSAEI